VSDSYDLCLQALIFDSHLAGYRDSKPVRIGNGAAFHQQFDIYGELMDAVYLYNKYGKPITWDQWVAVRQTLGMSDLSWLLYSGAD
jgi:GH15 family glucan-1,4-alpha-glucosidase